MKCHSDSAQVAVLAMKEFVGLIGLLALTGCYTPQVIGKDCALKKIPIVSTDPSRNEIYVARTATTEVQFRNEDAPNPAEVFPEPLVRVKNLKTTKSCDIKDGSGIWSSAYLDVNERVLVLNGYSGSKDTLYFYNPATCQKLAELDVSGKSWEIFEDRIRTQQYCMGNDLTPCPSSQEFKLNHRCLVDDSKSITVK